MTFSNRFELLGILEDPIELWDTFKREILQTAKEYTGEQSISKSGSASVETLGNIERIPAARFLEIGTS